MQIQFGFSARWEITIFRELDTKNMRQELSRSYIDQCKVTAAFAPYVSTHNYIMYRYFIAWLLWGELIDLREVKRSLSTRLNSVFVGCLLIVVPYFITPSKFSCCHVLGGAFAITQDQSLLAVIPDFPELSDFTTASFELKYSKNNEVNHCKECYTVLLHHAGSYVILLIPINVFKFP